MTDLEFFMQEVGDDGNGHTLGQFGDAAMRQKTKEAAGRFFRGGVEWTRLQPECTGDPEDVMRQNIGYWSGYCSSETRARVAKLYAECGVYHPIFGPLTREVSPEEAFESGRQEALR